MFLRLDDLRALKRVVMMQDYEDPVSEEVIAFLDSMLRMEVC